MSLKGLHGRARRKISMFWEKERNKSELSGGAESANDIQI